MNRTIQSSHDLKKSLEENGGQTYISSTATLTVEQRHVVLGDFTGTVTLPPVLEAEGLIFTLDHPAGTNAITLTDQDDSNDWSDKTIDAVDDGIALYSSGGKWWILINDIA